MPALTPEQLKHIEHEKALTLALYQARLDKVCDENDSKMAHWEEKVQAKLEHERRLWEEGKTILREQRKIAQREIDHMFAIPPEEWHRAFNSFDSKYSNVVSAYYKATSIFH